MFFSFERQKKCISNIIDYKWRWQIFTWLFSCHLLCELSMFFLLEILYFFLTYLYELFIRILASHIYPIFFYILKFCDILKCLIFVFHICFLLCAFFYSFCCCYNFFSSLIFVDCPPTTKAPASPSHPLLPHVLWEASIDLPQTTPCRLGGIIFLLRWDRFLSIMGWIVSPR